MMETRGGLGDILKEFFREICGRKGLGRQFIGVINCQHVKVMLSKVCTGVLLKLKGAIVLRMKGKLLSC